VNRARICLVSEIFHPEDQGGQGQQAYALARRIRADGMEVQVVTRCNFAGSNRRECLEGIEVSRLPPAGLYKGRGWAAMLPTCWFLLLLFVHLLRTRRSYDVLLVQGVKAILIPPLAGAALLRKPCIVKIDAHAELEQDLSSESLARMRMRGIDGVVRLWGRVRMALLRRANAIVAISAEIEAALVRKLGEPAPIVRIPNGIDLRHWRSSSVPRAELKRRLRLPDRLLVVYAGRLSRAKGLPMLLQVWASVSLRHPDAHLVLIGAGDRSADNCESELHDFVRSYDLDARVSFIGHVDNVADYLHAADLFVQSSESEGFGLALVEAMAAGLPCVSTAVGIAPEVIDDTNGWLVPAQNPAAFEGSLNAALQQRDRWPSMRESAQAAVAKFELSTVAQRYAALITQQLAASAAGVAKSTVRRNATWLLGCRIGADLLNFVLFLVVTNAFGPAGIGVYAYGFAIAGLIYAATTLGIDEYAIREYVRRSRERRQRLVSDLLGAQAVIAALAVAALWLYLHVTGVDGEVGVIVGVLSLYQLCASLSNTLFVPAMAEQRMMAPALIVLASRAAALIAAAALIWIAEAGLMWALLPFGASGLVMAMLAARSARSFGITLVPRIGAGVLRDAVRNVWSFAAVDIMGQLFTRVGVIALVLWVGEHAAGIYAAGLKLAEVACMPLWFLGQAMYPILSRTFARPEEFRRLASKLLIGGSLLALSIASAMALLVPSLLVPLLGKGYAGSETVIAAMASLVLVQGIEIVIGRLLLSANASVARAVWVSCGAMICAVATALLTPRFGIVAAIGVTVASYVMVDVLYLRSLLPALRSYDRKDASLTEAEPSHTKAAA
jgi:glycosyltransferase involved in cell wall biosynthesis/O-antigen/teichoic acid export membrane protein